MTRTRAEPAACPPGRTTGRRVGVFGGTFDPPHLGHLLIASETRIALGLDEVVFVPAGRPPHKATEEVSPAADRLAMLRLAVAGDARFRVDPLEVERDGPSWTAATLAELAERHPDDQRWFLMGADSLDALHTWRDPARIVGLARLAVSPRRGSGLDLGAVAARVPAVAGRVDAVAAPLVDIASRDLRRRVRDGVPVDYLVPPEVVAYIRDRRLYRGPDG